MNDTAPLGQTTLFNHLNNSLNRTQQSIVRFRRLNNSLAVVSLSGSALGTLVTGVTVANGPILGTGVDGWRFSCILAALLGFITTLSMGVAQQMRISERLANSQSCKGRLRALELSLTTQNKPWELVVQEYESVLREFPDILD